MHNVRGRPEVVFFRDLDELAKVEKSWAELASRKDEACFFQSPNWIRHVAEIRQSRSSEKWQVCLATLWRGDRLIALWPLSLHREGLLWIARCLDDPFGQFAGILVEDDEDIEAIVGDVIEGLRAERLAAGILIERVVEQTALHRGLIAKRANVIYSDQSVFLDFRPFDSFEAYLKTRRAKTRKNLRNAKNRLMRDYGFEHDVLTGDNDIRSIMDEALETRLVWMQDHAKTAPAFRDPDFRRLLDGLSEGRPQENLIGFRLRTGKTPIAVQWGFVYAERYYAYISARNPEFDDYSPGRVHLGMVIEACYERGISVVELMAPASDYKMNWTDQTKRIDDLGLALSPGGVLYLDLWRRHGRSMARMLYHSLPDAVRRRISALTNPKRTS